jgi:spore maturation protein CgeB
VSTPRRDGRALPPPPAPLQGVMLGLSITSSWGNGHASTYRGLARELHQRGHRILFLERDQPWYAQNRDLTAPPYARVEMYGSLAELEERFTDEVRRADFVMVGSFVPDGVAVGDWVTRTAEGVSVFYDIDTPVTLASLERGETSYLSPALIPRYDAYLSVTGGPTLERVRKLYGARRVGTLYCSADPEAYFPQQADAAWDLGYLGTYSADRQPVVNALLLEPARQRPRARFVVAGPQYPAGLAWPPNVDRIEHPSPTAHRLFYNRQRFTLNVTRADMVVAGYSPSVRLFEACACGTPVISDYWGGLESFFVPGEEILVARSTADVLRVLTCLSEDQRRDVGRRARARVLAEHAPAQRAAQLEAHLLASLADRAARRAPRRPTEAVVPSFASRASRA